MKTGLKLAKLLLPCVLLLLSIGNANAQKSKIGKKLYPVFKELKSVSDTSYTLQDSAINVGIRIVNAEFEVKPAIDTLFMADLCADLGKLMQNSYIYDEASASYLLLAAAYYRTQNLEEKSGEFLGRYLYTYNLAVKYKKPESYIRSGDSFLYNLGNKDSTVWFTVAADTIAWNATKDTVFVRIKGGYAQGVVLNSRFDVFTTFDTFYNIKRTSILAGSGRITKVNDFYSEGFIALNEDFKDTLYVGDAFEVKVDIDTRKIGTTLHDVALYNVKFKGYDGSMYFTQGAGNNTVNMVKFDHPIKMAILKDFKDACKYYNEVDSTILQAKIEGGPYAGYTYDAALKAATIFDLEMFFDFVKSYPGKYINNTYKLIETYATWLINNCPTGHDEARIIQRILNEPETEVMQHARLLVGYYQQIEKADSLFSAIVSQRNGDNVETALADYLRMQKLAEKIGVKSTDSMCSVSISWYYHVLKENKKALDWADHALHFVKPEKRLLLNIYKAIYYSEMNRNEDAIAMCDSALRIDSTNYYAQGYKGWNLLKSGRIKPAMPYCKYAFEIDSFVQWTTINYGHALMLKGNKSEANRLYKKSFEAMSSGSDFYAGLLSDFNYFINTGINEDEFKNLKNTYTQYYNDHFKYKLNGDSLKGAAAKLKDNERYGDAAEIYKKALQEYLKCTPVNWEDVRLATRWVAYSYYKNKDYRQSLGQYKKAADLTIDKGLGDDNLISDYTDVSHLYNWLDDTLREMEYESRAASLEVALREKRDSKKLYIITVGTGNTKHNDSFSVSDANAISTRLSEGGKLYFDKVITHNITGVNASTSELKKALDSAIYTLQQNDVFVFYYSGWARYSGEEFITLADGKFALKDLAGYLGQVPAARQVHIADCNGLNWRKWYQNDNFGLLANQKSSLVFFGYKNSRIEEPQLKHSVLTAALMDAWDYTISQGAISASQWIAAASLDMMNNNHLYAIESQTYGHDFIVGKAKVKSTEKDTVAPIIELFGAAVTRGGSNIAVVTNKSVNAGSITDESRIVYARANGVKLTIAANGRFELPKELLGVKNIIIEAQDEFGNLAHREFQVSISENSVNVGGVKYAYLFASQDYKYWSDLVNPLEDAQSIADILKENYGYVVTLIPNPDKRTIAEKLDYIRRFKYAPNDQLLVFFAGHGNYDSVWGGFYVCPESLPPAQDPYFDTYYPQKNIADLLDNSTCKNVFLVMDVCFGGKMFDKQEKHEYINVNDGYNMSPEEFIKRQLAISCRQFLTSGGNNYVADGVAGNHSPFASRFLIALEEAATHKDYITASEVMDYLRTMRTIGNDKKSFPRYGFFGGDKDGEFVMKVMKKIQTSAVIAKE